MAIEIEVVNSDITKTDTKLIVNAANNEFWMGAGVAGAIKKAGGEVVESEAVAKGPVMPGQVIATTAGRLPYAYVLHAAVMGQDLKTNARLIRQCTLAALNLTEKLGGASVALPAFGTGVGQFPFMACAHLMVGVVWAFRETPKVIKRVQFCLYDEMGYKLFSQALAEKLSSQS